MYLYINIKKNILSYISITFADNNVFTIIFSNHTNLNGFKEKYK